MRQILFAVEALLVLALIGWGVLRIWNLLVGRRREAIGKLEASKEDLDIARLNKLARQLREKAKKEAKSGSVQN